MAKCGIEKYDKLPARIGFIDVDYLRWRLYRCNNPTMLYKIPIINWFLPSIKESVRYEILSELEKACEGAEKK